MSEMETRGTLRISYEGYRHEYLMLDEWHSSWALSQTLTEKAKDGWRVHSWQYTGSLYAVLLERDVVEEAG